MPRPVAPPDDGSFNFSKLVKRNVKNEDIFSLIAVNLKTRKCKKGPRAQEFIHHLVVKSFLSKRSAVKHRARFAMGCINGKIAAVASFLGKMSARMMRRSAFGLALVAVIQVGPGRANAAPGDVVVLNGDRGGYLHHRMVEIMQYSHRDASFRLHGGECYSSCTLYLSLKDVCIEPGTVFGFHGPSAANRGLSAQEFDYFSAVMASYYPEPLRGWFMQTARFAKNDVMKIRGKDLIRLGFRQCNS